MKTICIKLNATDGSRKQEAQASKPAAHLTSWWTGESCMYFFFVYLLVYFSQSQLLFTDTYYGHLVSGP